MNYLLRFYAKVKMAGRLNSHQRMQERQGLRLEQELQRRQDQLAGREPVHPLEQHP